MTKSKGKGILVMIMLLAFVGQTVASTILPCQPTSQHSSMLMSEAHHSVPAQDVNDNPGIDSSAVKTETSDCCGNQGDGCTMNNCIATVMIPACNQDLISSISTGAPMYYPNSAQSQYPSSVYRPPISC